MKFFEAYEKMINDKSIYIARNIKGKSSFKEEDVLHFVDPYGTMTLDGKKHNFWDGELQATDWLFVDLIHCVFNEKTKEFKIAFKVENIGDKTLRNV